MAHPSRNQRTTLHETRCSEEAGQVWKDVGGIATRGASFGENVGGTQRRHVRKNVTMGERMTLDSSDKHGGDTETL